MVVRKCKCSSQVQAAFFMGTHHSKLYRPSHQAVVECSSSSTRTSSSNNSSSHSLIKAAKADLQTSLVTIILLRHQEEAAIHSPVSKESLEVERSLKAHSVGLYQLQE